MIHKSKYSIVLLKHWVLNDNVSFNSIILIPLILHSPTIFAELWTTSSRWRIGIVLETTYIIIKLTYFKKKEFSSSPLKRVKASIDTAKLIRREMKLHAGLPWLQANRSRGVCQRVRPHQIRKSYFLLSIGSLEKLTRSHGSQRTVRWVRIVEKWLTLHLRF